MIRLLLALAALVFAVRWWYYRRAAALRAAGMPADGPCDVLQGVHLPWSDEDLVPRRSPVLPARAAASLTAVAPLIRIR